MKKISAKSVGYGVGAALTLLTVYFLVLTLVSGWSFAESQFASYRYFILSLVAGFGIQIALYQHIKELVQSGVGMGKVVGVSGTTSGVAMVSCCAHYLVNLVPVLGVTGVVTFVAQYQTGLFWVGIFSNIAGIWYIARRIKSITRRENMKYQYPLSKNIEIKIVKPSGEYAHENFSESRYAVDFLVDVGTPVLAARGGTVWKVKADSDKWGLHKNLAQEVNFVAVDHGDGTYAEYLHLGKDKVEVHEEQKVKVGDLLGYTGLSGVMDKPHLHLNVFKVENGKGISIPAEFEKKSP